MLGIFRFFAEFLSDVMERRQVIKRFNDSSRATYYRGDVEHLAKARTTVGNSSFRHDMSRFRSGFTVQLLGISIIPKPEATEMAKALLTNGPFMRQLMAIGYDTLEIETGAFIYNWSISDYNNLHDFTLGE